MSEFTNPYLTTQGQRYSNAPEPPVRYAQGQPAYESQPATVPLQPAAAVVPETAQAAPLPQDAEPPVMFEQDDAIAGWQAQEAQQTIWQIDRAQQGLQAQADQAAVPGTVQAFPQVQSQARFAAQPPQAAEPAPASRVSTPVATPATGAQPYVPGYRDSPGARHVARQQAQAPSQKPSGAKSFAFGFLGALAACAVAFGCFGVWWSSQPDATAEIQRIAQSAALAANESESGRSLGSADPSIIVAGEEDLTLAEAVAAKALPSVVYVGVYQSASSYGYFGYGYGGDSGELTETSLGSGIVLTEDGYILTNYHVVEGAEALKVNVSGTEYDAEVVGTDPSSDIAVIKADAEGLTPADIGDSDSLVVGEWVMSIGSPFGLEQSVATGVVSATSRSTVMDNSSSYYGYEQGQTTLYANLIQTDAAINPGNSGGALVDADGKVIGVNTLITSYSGNYSGVGFAIPINYAINIADQIIGGKTPTHARLGVSLSTVNGSIAKRYDFSVDQGAYVATVMRGSGAEAAGIEEGDIITAVDGKKVSSATDVTLAVRSHNPGETIQLTVDREGDSIDFDVMLGSDDEDAPVSSRRQRS